MIEFRMPSLGADMDSGTVVEWKIKPGDQVHRGDIVAEVETQKGVIEVEVWNNGRVEDILVKAGEQVSVGSILALLNSGDEPAIRSEVEESPHSLPPIELPSHRKRHFRASPLARKIAKQNQIDITAIIGSGHQGTITRNDVETYIDQNHKNLANSQKKPTNKSPAMRQAIAAAMSRSKRDIPHYYLQTELSMARSLAYLDQVNRDQPVTRRVLPAALYIKAVAWACKQVPEMNGYWIDGTFHPSQDVNVGMGISLRQGGLVAPAIHHVETKTITEVMVDLLELVSRARRGRLKSSEISDPTITVTSLGDQGIETAFGVIYPPQVAIVGFGKIIMKPWAEGQMLGVHPVVSVTLSADHRSSDGHRGGIFLNHIRDQLLRPEEFLAPMGG